MQSIKCFSGIGATATNTVAMSAVTGGEVSPFNRGNNVVLMVVPTADADFTVQFLTDDATTGSYVEVIAATDMTTGKPLIFNITVPHNLRCVVASRTAGTCDVYMLGDS